MKEFVLDASFALRWCFEDEATDETESILTLLQNQEAAAWVPGIWRYEMLNALGKGISRDRITRSKGCCSGRKSNPCRSIRSKSR